MKTEYIHQKLKQIDKKQFQHDLITWFENEQRDLPWRKSQDPYKIWISEIMLQQTKVDTVIPYYERFINKFPTPADLSSATEQEVLKAWEGLGYYSRARNLQHAVREVVSEYGGIVPNTPERLGSLKGVGPYTTGAILSIAYDIPAPAVDGNVMRVLSRIFLIEENIAKPSVRSLFEHFVEKLISKQNPSSFNQGLMELGALICTPNSPACLLCPVQQHCQAFAEGKELELPIKEKAKKKKIIPYTVLVIRDDHEGFLIEKRPDKGLLANLWQFPMAPLSDIDKKSIPHWFYGEYGIKIKIEKQIDTMKHVFSHIIWELDVIEASIIEEDANKMERPDTTVVSIQDMANFPMPVPHQKIVKQLQ
ncbi:A/G-specific adenine glycosylase [Aquibacillus sp. 3ASR75-11]|uniref:Adenine DNA glycosylase n=1 Tax=Terrihalobacillus insolitus TaxID=2950438 RepID=A0A9X3WW97_9BACI|nr:A/G-specific adenine glycosylase [Terrihalobacillus insolitus]MDC3425281.1 A/G-specific adenine glycosylase [Terrihalobacillus insolitus]